MYCSNCGNELADDAPMCPDCGSPTQDEITPNDGGGDGDSKSKVLAALLSVIIPGVGQAYNGQIAKGAAWLVVYVLAAAASSGVGTPGTGVVLVIVWGLAIYDAWRQAGRINAGKETTAL